MRIDGSGVLLVELANIPERFPTERDSLEGGSAKPANEVGIEGRHRSEHSEHHLGHEGVRGHPDSSVERSLRRQRGAEAVTRFDECGDVFLGVAVGVDAPRPGRFGGDRSDGWFEEAVTLCVQGGGPGSIPQLAR
jgi:hypothetical protein